MREKRNKMLLISLSVLLALIAFFSWQGRTNNQTDVDKSVFNLDDYKTIDKVVLESSSGKQELAFNGTRWKLNGAFDADRNMVSVLFATLEQAKAKRKISSGGNDSLQSAIKNNGVKVSLFAGQSLQQEFYASGNATKTQAYFFDPAGKEAYVMEIPGYRVYVSGILELDENGWRDKYVFNFNWRNFTGLDVKFPNKPSENFKVSVSKEFFGIDGLEADTAKLNTFLDNISLLTVDRFVNDAKARDSIAKGKPEMEVIVRDVANREYRLLIFAGGKSEVLGLVPENQLAHFNIRKIQAIVRPRSFFKKR
jgi:hypothetical protein